MYKVIINYKPRDYTKETTGYQKVIYLQLWEASSWNLESSHKEILLKSLQTEIIITNITTEQQ